MRGQGTGRTSRQTKRTARQTKRKTKQTARRTKRKARRTTRRIRRTTRRMARRHRRRRILVGGMVLLAIGAVAYGAVKLTRKDADRIEQHTSTSVEELSDEDLVAAMEELGIQSIELTDEDKAALTAEANQATVAGAKVTYKGQAQASPPPTAAATTAATATTAAAPSYLDELERLAALRDQGVITEEEFAAKKGQLLGL